MIFVDSDVFVIDLRYQRDEKYETNKQFLNLVSAEGITTTSVFNILEVCGILSFNLNNQQLLDLYHHFPRKYNLLGMDHIKLSAALPSFPLSSVFEIMSLKSSFGDSLIICSVLEVIDQIECFVSWNADHFTGKIPRSVLTPSEYLNTRKT